VRRQRVSSQRGTRAAAELPPGPLGVPARSWLRGDGSRGAPAPRHEARLSRRRFDEPPLKSGVRRRNRRKIACATASHSWVRCRCACGAQEAPAAASQESRTLQDCAFRRATPSCRGEKITKPGRRPRRGKDYTCAHVGYEQVPPAPRSPLVGGARARLARAGEGGERRRGRTGYPPPAMPSTASRWGIAALPHKGRGDSICRGLPFLPVRPTHVLWPRHKASLRRDMS
jgi:hypothetical protein